MSHCLLGGLPASGALRWSLAWRRFSLSSCNTVVRTKQASRSAPAFALLLRRRFVRYGSYSLDGVRPPPAPDGAKSPMHIARHHLDSVFVGSKETQTLQLCNHGLKPHSYRQVLSLMLGQNSRVECQVAQNAGGLAFNQFRPDYTGRKRQRTHKQINLTRQLGRSALLPMIPLVCCGATSKVTKRLTERATTRWRVQNCRRTPMTPTPSCWRRSSRQSSRR